MSTILDGTTGVTAPNLTASIDMDIPAVNTITGFGDQKFGTGTINGNSATVTDAFITNATYVSIYPFSTKVGTWSINTAFYYNSNTVVVNKRIENRNFLKNMAINGVI